MTRGGKRKNQTGRPKKPYRVKRMSVPEPLVYQVTLMILQLTFPDMPKIALEVLAEMKSCKNDGVNRWAT